MGVANLLVLPVEVDLDGVRLGEDVDEVARGLDAALPRKLVQWHLACRWGQG